MFDLDLIDRAAEKIQQQLVSGEIAEACCMSSVSTPVTESWETAQQLAENAELSAEQKSTILRSLNPAIQKQLDDTGYDDFDLIYERLLQLISSS